MKFGIDRLCEDLVVLGFNNEFVEDPQKNVFVIVQKYSIELGRFAGRVIDLGLMVPPNYPQGICSCIHVRSIPHLLDIKDTVQNVRNITESSLGPEWRYWSRNFGWAEERSTRRLMSQINEIFLHA
jgi:hypothetical protein